MARDVRRRELERIRVTEVRMSCGHHAQFAVSPPGHGERIYCTRCEDMRTVIKTNWIAQCAECVYRKEYVHLSSVRGSVKQHLTVNPLHAVIIYGDSKTYRITADQITASDATLF